MSFQKWKINEMEENRKRNIFRIGDHDNNYI